MWSIPYNMQFYSTWAAVGLTHKNQKPPSFRQMYRHRNLDSFRRAKAGHLIEFSNEQFYITAFMSGGTNSKPIFKISLVPQNSADFASLILEKLGKPITR